MIKSKGIEKLQVIFLVPISIQIFADLRRGDLVTDVVVESPSEWMTALITHQWHTPPLSPRTSDVVTLTTNNL